MIYDMDIGRLIEVIGESGTYNLGIIRNANKICIPKSKKSRLISLNWVNVVRDNQDCTLYLYMSLIWGDFVFEVSLKSPDIYGSLRIFKT